jgi:hypothetical protein
VTHDNSRVRHHRPAPTYLCELQSFDETCRLVDVTNFANSLKLLKVRIIIIKSETRDASDVGFDSEIKESVINDQTMTLSFCSRINESRRVLCLKSDGVKLETNLVVD